jgi:hypothetical protein
MYNHKCFHLSTIIASKKSDKSLQLFHRLSFAVSTGIIKEKARVVAMDLRGHGKSVTDNDFDLSVEVQSNR